MGKYKNLGSLKLFSLDMHLNYLGFLGGSDRKESACNTGDLGLIPGSGRSPKGGQPTPVFLLGKFHREAWWAIAHGVTKESDTTEPLSRHWQRINPGFCITNV